MQRYRVILTICALLLAPCVLAGCGGSQYVSSAPLLSGVQGQARRGPIAPLSQGSQPNDAPLPFVKIVVQRTDGTEVARQAADASGNFKIGVSPGQYLVVGLPTGSGASLPSPPAPQPVTVTDNQYVSVNVVYDTGIR